MLSVTGLLVTLPLELAEIAVMVVEPMKPTTVDTAIPEPFIITAGLELNQLTLPVMLTLLGLPEASL